MGNGEYDRTFHVNDFKTIKGTDTIQNRVIICLMTKLGELNHNLTYNGFGCGAWSYLKTNHTPLTKITIQEELKKSLNKIKGIKNVTRLQIEPKTHEIHSLNIFFSITLNNDFKIIDKLELRGI